jgi:hypothetical protein
MVSPLGLKVAVAALSQVGAMATGHSHTFFENFSRFLQTRSELHKAPEAGRTSPLGNDAARRGAWCVSAAHN